ncbi:MAG: hypothetical protein ABFD08_17770 [Syntrophomonas sp.]
MAKNQDTPADKQHLIEANRLWIKKRREEHDRKHAQILKLKQECKDIMEEIELFEALVRKLESNEVLETEKAAKQKAARNSSKTGIKAEEEAVSVENLPQREELRGDKLREQVAEILLDNYPAEIYYRDILNLLTGKGYKVAGKDPALNLLAHMVKDERFQRGDRRGVYTLAADFAASRLPGQIGKAQKK